MLRWYRAASQVVQANTIWSWPRFAALHIGLCAAAVAYYWLRRNLPLRGPATPGGTTHEQALPGPEAPPLTAGDEHGSTPEIRRLKRQSAETQKLLHGVRAVRKVRAEPSRELL